MSAPTDRGEIALVLAFRRVLRFNHLTQHLRSNEQTSPLHSDWCNNETDRLLSPHSATESSGIFIRIPLEYLAPMRFLLLSGGNDPEARKRIPGRTFA
jgi:hypothetical protein